MKMNSTNTAIASLPNSKEDRESRYKLQAVAAAKKATKKATRQQGIKATSKTQNQEHKT
jgi:hypothetical protein